MLAGGRAVDQPPVRGGVGAVALAEGPATCEGLDLFVAERSAQVGEAGGVGEAGAEDAGGRVL